MTHERPGGWAANAVTAQHRRIDPGDQYPQDAYLHTAPIITPAPGPGPSAYDTAADNWRRKMAEQSTEQPMFLGTPPTMELISDPNTPPWRGIDTFLRRGVMAAAFILLWTMIVVGILTAGWVVNAVSNLSDPGTSSVDDTLWNTDEPLLPPASGEECIGEVPC